MGVAAEELFLDLRADACSDMKDVCAALRELERLDAVLLARKAELVADAAERIAQRKAVEEKVLGKGIFSFSARESALVELAPALGVSSGEANAMLAFAEDMTTHYPNLGARLATGEVTARTARFVGDLLRSAPAPWREKLDAWLAVQAPRWRLHSKSKIQGLIEAQYIRWDSEWAKERRERAHAERGLFFKPVGDGMAKVWGAMPLLEAALVKDKLDAVARTVCPQDPRAMWTRRSDALSALVGAGGGGEDKLACECGRDTCQAAQRPTPQTKPVTLVVDLAILANLSDLPAWLAGAPIDPQLARAMAKASTNIRFTTTPDLYKPTPAVETHVNARDQHCRFPGCHRRARTELDHTIPFDHENPESGGQTTPNNLKRLCKHHHRTKTHARWRDQQDPDGTIHWTSPTGQHYETSPSG